MVIERDGMMQWMKEHLWFPLIVAILGGLIVTILGGIILQLVLTGQPPKFISDFFTEDTSVEDVSSEGNESIGVFGVCSGAVGAVGLVGAGLTTGVDTDISGFGVFGIYVDNEPAVLN